MMTFVVRAS